MTTLKDILNSLPLEDRRRLDYAFEYGLSQHVILPDQRYIGVNINPKASHLEPETILGKWSIGKIKCLGS